jgi:ArsR family transcriptional regulator
MAGLPPAGRRGAPQQFRLQYIPFEEYSSLVKLIQIYECLCDETRLRILHLLTRGPLCVCHIQAVLRQPQVKVSKHLAYLRERGLVEGRRNRNWMIYQLPAQRPPELEAHLKCLQDCAGEQPQFAADLKTRERIAKDISEVIAGLCEPAAAGGRVAARGRGCGKEEV